MLGKLCIIVNYLINFSFNLSKVIIMKPVFVFIVLILPQLTMATDNINEVKQPITTTAQQFYDSYITDSKQADKTFKYNPVLLTAAYSHIVKENVNKKVKPALYLTTSAHQIIKAYGDDNFVDSLPNLSKGQIIKLSCTGGGLENGQVIVNNCVSQ